MFRPNRTVNFFARLSAAAAGIALVAGPVPVQGPDASGGRTPGASATYLGFPLREHSVRVELDGGETLVLLDGERLSAERLRANGDRIEILGDDCKTLLAAVELGAQRGGFHVVDAQPRVRMGVFVGKRTDGGGPSALPEGEFDVVVTAVEPGLPADRAGLRVHDVLRFIDDRQAMDVDDLREALAGKVPGEELDLLVQREGEELEVVVHLDETGPIDSQGLPFALPFSRPAFGIGSQGRVLVWSSEHFSTADIDPADLAHDHKLFAHLRKSFQIREGEPGGEELEFDEETSTMRVTFGGDVESAHGMGTFVSSEHLTTLEARLVEIESKLELLLQRTAPADAADPR